MRVLREHTGDVHGDNEDEFYGIEDDDFEFGGAKNMLVYATTDGHTVTIDFGFADADSFDSFDGCAFYGTATASS